MVGMRNRLTARLALLAIVTTWLAGCEEFAAFDEETRRELAATSRARKGGALDHYLVIRGRKNGTEAFIQTPPDTWAPFDVSIRTGIFDPAQAARVDGVRVCLELDTIGFTIFYDVCAVRSVSAGAWNVFSYHGPPATSLPGALPIAAQEIELRAETDGTTLRFHAREAGAKDWSPIGQMPFPAQSPPLKMSFGATGLAPKAEVGFDSPSHVSAPPPGPLTAVQQVVADLNLALLRGLAAYLALDGASPDFATAAASLGEAAAALGDAATGAAALPASDENETVEKRIGQASKSLGKAQAKVAAEKAAKALNNLEKAALRAAQAVLILAPQPPLTL
jgi:hypothetical protein